MLIFGLELEKSAPWNCEFGTKTCLIWVMFFPELHKIIVIYETSTFRFIKMQTLMLKETINSETKLPYLGIFGLEIWKNYCHTLRNFSIPKYLCNTKKILSFGPQYVLFGYCFARYRRNYCHIWNQHLRICENAKLCVEEAKLNLGLKLPYLLLLELSLKKLLSYLKSAQWNLPKCQVSCNTKKLWVWGTKSFFCSFKP